MAGRKKGVAVVVVMFFAFAISIAMFFLLQSTSNLHYQTKRTVYDMQAYYLAQSALQYAKLHISLLPKEVYDFYGNGDNPSGNALSKCDSALVAPMSLDNFYNQAEKYDLYESGKSSDLSFPYSGRFSVTELKYVLSSGNMRMVQDSYKLSVEATILHGEGKSSKDSVTEEFVISRYSGRR